MNAVVRHLALNIYNLVIYCMHGINLIITVMLYLILLGREYKDDEMIVPEV